MNILLIDKRVQDYETIVAAIDPALAVGVVFDYYEDTFDTLKTRMRELIAVGNSTAIGLIRHNYKAPMFTMLASADVAPVEQVATQDPDLATWAQFRDFITWCKTELNTAHFDMMACALYSDPDWKYVIDTLTAQTGVTVRASTDNTGAAAQGGNWFLESHTGVNLKTVYFTEAIEEYRGVLYLAPRTGGYNARSRQYWTKGFATGLVVVIGANNRAPSTTSSDVVAIYNNGITFAALKSDGSVKTWTEYTGNWWNDQRFGSDSSSVTARISSDVISVCPNQWGFAALKSNGNVVSWGDYGVGLNYDITSVVEVYSTNYAFAVLKNNGSVQAWGGSNEGGDTRDNNGKLNSGVVAVYSTYGAFAALKNDGSVYVWGHYSLGGDPNSVSSLTSGVVAVYSAYANFAALKNNGSVYMWPGTAPISVSEPGSDVVSIYSNDSAFAALKSDGSVITWGDSSTGGDSTDVSGNLTSGVVRVSSTNRAFAALKRDGSVVVWGNSNYGGNSSSVAGMLTSGIVDVYSIGGAFAALKTDGSVVTWGAGDAPTSVTDPSSGVVAIYGSYGFATLKRDGRVDYWGGATPPSSLTDPSSNVVTIYNGNYLVALKTSATTFDLSMSYYTDIDRYDILRNKNNRRRVNLTTLNNNVFTLSNARHIQSFNPTIPSGKTLRIIVPDYVSSSYSITSTATIPPSSSGVIIACDEGEPVTISGTTYVNYGSFVYTLNANGSYVKTTSTTINQVPYALYGGDGINSSGIAILDPRETTTLAFVSPPTTKSLTDPAFTVVASSASSGAVTYTSSNTARATVGLTTGLVTLVDTGSVTITAAQAASAQYTAPTNTTFTMTIGAPANLSRSIVTTSLANKNLTGISLVGTNLANISLANARLRNVDFSGSVVTGASFINADISGATNLPVFSTTQKLQLLRNANNVAIGAVQISTPLSGSEINAALSVPIPDISGATFVVKAPAYNVNNEKVVSITAEDVANDTSLYIPMNSGESVKVNGVAYTFNGTNILDSSGSVIRFITVLGKPFRLYAGSIVGLNVADQLNNIKISGDGLYDIMISLFAAKT